MLRNETAPEPARRAGPYGARALSATALAAAAVLGLSACSADAADPPADAAEKVTAGDRLAVSAKGKVLVLDTATLKTLGSYDTEDFTRVNAAGDGSDVLVTTSKGFQVLDTAEPKLTDLTFAADTAGHVVRHGDKTILFADGTGRTTIFDHGQLPAAVASGKLPDVETIDAPKPHHGVSIELDDGTVLTTIGTPDTRSGVRVLDKDHKEIARNEKCPGVHGEGAAANEAVIFGCEDGALLYTDGTFQKFQAPGEYGRMGNAYVTEKSPLIVGDYNDDPDAEGVELDQVALIDTEKKTYKPVDLADGVSYTWKGLARTDDGGAWLLGTDGALHKLDPATGELSDSHPVIDAWKAPIDWQQAHPSLSIHGDTAYVSEPAAKKIHAVDLNTGNVERSAEIEGAAVEIAVS